MDKKLQLVQFILSRLDGGSADLWKIYKLMYFIDFAFYAEHKRSLSGAEYYNWPYGPVPMDKQQYSIENIIDKGAHETLWRKIDEKHVQIQTLANTDNFKDAELIVIENILSRYGGLSGKELVDLSHEDMPWKMTKEGEKIEYEYVFWRDKEPIQIEDITQLVLG